MNYTRSRTNRHWSELGDIYLHQRTNQSIRLELGKGPIEFGYPESLCCQRRLDTRCARWPERQCGWSGNLLMVGRFRQLFSFRMACRMRRTLADLDQAPSQVVSAVLVPSVVFRSFSNGMPSDSLRSLTLTFACHVGSDLLNRQISRFWLKPSISLTDTR